MSNALKLTIQDRVSRFLILVLVLLICGCSGVNTAGPVFDKSIGLTEEELRKKFGDPDSDDVLEPRQLMDELRMPIHEMTYGAGREVPVREFYYDRKDDALFFWLTNEGDVWTVIRDAKVPDGVLF